MKKTMKFLSMAALALVGAVMTGCSSDDNAVEEAPKQPANYSVTKTLRVNLDGGEAGARGITRALSEGGTKTFATGDKLAITYTKAEDGMLTKVETDALKAGDISGDGKTAMFTVTFTEAPKTGEDRNDLTYIYPASIATNDGYIDNSQLNSQDGTLASLARNLDACRKYTKWNGGDLPTLTLENAFTIGKFIIKNPSGTAFNNALTSMTISDGTNTYTITPSASAADDPIWVAMRPISAGTPVTVTATDGTYNYSKTITIASGKDLLAGSITPINVTMKLVPSDAINGLFSVSSTKQVYFSKGNLQAVGTTISSPSSGWTWQFAEYQYDYPVGGRGYYMEEPETGNNYINGNGTLSASGTVDLFYWSESATYYGISKIEDNTPMKGAFVDWGGNIGSGWYTLSKDEWDYLFSGRANAASKYGHGSVNSVTGMIVLPDSWTLPDGLSFTAGSSSSNYYTTVQWSQMESAGAVFLPISGLRVITGVYEVGIYGYYWSSSVYEGNDVMAYRLEIQSGYLPSATAFDKNYGFAVRLVKNAE